MGNNCFLLRTNISFNGDKVQELLVRTAELYFIIKGGEENSVGLFLVEQQLKWTLKVTWALRAPADL